VNRYEWGDFKGDPSAWMAKYFDAFPYVANWGCEWRIRTADRRRHAALACDTAHDSALPAIRPEIRPSPGRVWRHKEGSGIFEFAMHSPWFEFVRSEDFTCI
jgi:hypothetical protein